MTKKRRIRKTKKTATPAENTTPETPAGNVEPMGKRYQLTNEELLQYNSIQGNLRLANEKEESVKMLRDTANMLSTAWGNGITARLGLQGKSYNVDPGTGVVFVPDEPKTKKKGGKS